jgi:hypothetical protein
MLRDGAMVSGYLSDPAIVADARQRRPRRDRVSLRVSQVTLLRRPSAISFETMAAPLISIA